MAMCGIVGYIGKQEAQSVLLSGMRRLEYRGYDSAGVAIFGPSAICVKAVGGVDDLVKTIKSDVPGQIGIGHTRWATHGEPSVANAHPHFDCKGDIYLVHNGIIENYLSLKKRLEARGHKFVSATDTEVISHLVEDYYTGDVEEAFVKAIKELVGAYAIVMIHRLEPDKLFAAKYGSPLVLGVGCGENIVASGLTAFIGHTKHFVELADGEIAVVQNLGYRIRNIGNNEYVEKCVQKIDWDLGEIEKGGYAHFMLKEIHEQPTTIRNALRGRIDHAKGLVVSGGLNENVDDLRWINNIFVVACGTAYHASLYADYLFEQLVGVRTKAMIASEFRYRKIIVDDDHTLLLTISQSGETADTKFAVQEGRRKGCLTAGIVNVVGSAIAKEVHLGIYNHSGPEISVASTKAFTSQLSILVLVAIYLARQRKMTSLEAQRYLAELEMLPEKIEQILQKEADIKALAEKYQVAQNFIYLGRGYNYPTALEGALKLKELSYVHAEGYPAGELKHGSIALIDEFMPTLGIIPQDSVYEKTFSNLMEVKARKGKIIAVATEGDEKIADLADDVIFIPPTLDFLNPILATIPLQLFAYHMAILKGRNVDKPRNLAKSVVVE